MMGTAQCTSCAALWVAPPTCCSTSGTSLLLPSPPRLTPDFSQVAGLIHPHFQAGALRAALIPAGPTPLIIRPPGSKITGPGPGGLNTCPIYWPCALGQAPLCASGSPSLKGGDNGRTVGGCSCYCLYALPPRGPGLTPPGSRCLQGLLLPWLSRAGRELGALPGLPAACRPCPRGSSPSRWHPAVGG